MKNEIYEVLKEKQLKITPQRIAVLDAVLNLKNHPTADNIIEYIKKNYPNIAIGTVYKILETYVEKGILERVKTDFDVMRYDSVTEKHHHIYCNESGKIEDFVDDRLDNMLEEYFKKRKIPNFNIENIKVQISGDYINNRKKNNA